jgi:hypothetical protein
MKMDRKTALSELREELQFAEQFGGTKTELMQALRFAIKYLDDFDEEPFEQARGKIEAAIASKNSADLDEGTLEYALCAFGLYGRDRFEYASVHPVECAVCRSVHWPMGPISVAEKQGCDCAAYVFSKYDRNFVLAVYGSKRDSDLYEFVRAVPDAWKDADPVCDNCILKAVREGMLAKIPGDYPFGLVRYRDHFICEENAEPFEPPKLRPVEREVVEARRYYSDYLRGLEKNIAEYRATAASTQTWVTPEDDAETRRRADGLADHLHKHAVLTQTALDALDARERELAFRQWCGEDKGMERIADAHAVFKAIADSGKPGTVETWDAHLAMEALAELAKAMKR